MTDKCLDSIKPLDGRGNCEDITFLEIDLKSAVGYRADVRDLGPSYRAFSIGDAIGIDTDGVPLLHPPADHRKEQHDQESGGENKIQEALPDEIENEGDKEKDERQPCHDRRALKKRRRRGMNGDKFP